MDLRQPTPHSVDRPWPAFVTTITTRLQVNGKAVALTHEADRSLLDLLREELALTGTKRGCDHVILARHERQELSADGEASPQVEGAKVSPSPAFAAHFAEVRVDPDLGLVRVARLVSAVDGGRILNQKLARSQVIGGVIMGIGMTLLEETVFDARGRVANATFGDYLIPVNAAVPDLECVSVGEPERFNPLGIKGIGEIRTVGVSAAIANAVFHATGRRLRSLPIKIDKLL